MKIAHSIHHAFGICAVAAALTGCNGGGQSTLVSPGPIQQSAARSGANVEATSRLPAFGANGILKPMHPDTGRSWMAPDAKRNDLLYISDSESGDLYVYSYPRAKLEGTLTGLSQPEGVCVDKAGDVFVTNTGATEILEYAHGGTSPIATLSDPSYYPVGCAVDRRTGDLAVTNVEGFTSSGAAKPGNILIFKNAQGSPTTYSERQISNYFFCGYDDMGNLYVDGLYASNFAFAELPHHSTSFTNITLNPGIYQPGGVQWDGKYVAVGNEDLNNNIIYDYVINGTQGTLGRPGGTPLGGATLVLQFWIEGGQVIGPNHGGSGSVMFWNYPVGGSPTKTLTAFSTPIGATVSKASL